MEYGTNCCKLNNFIEISEWTITKLPKAPTIATLLNPIPGNSKHPPPRDGAGLHLEYSKQLGYNNNNLVIVFT